MNDVRSLDSLHSLSCALQHHRNVHGTQKQRAATKNKSSPGASRSHGSNDRPQQHVRGCAWLNLLRFLCVFVANISALFATLLTMCKITCMSSILENADLSRATADSSVFQSFWMGGFECSTHRLPRRKA